MSNLTQAERLAVALEEITKLVDASTETNIHDDAADTYRTIIYAGAGVRGAGDSFEELLSTSKSQAIDLAYGVAVLGEVINREADKLYAKAAIIDKLLGAGQ